MPVGWRTIEELVPENGPAAGEALATPCRGKKPGDRRSCPGPSHESGVHRGGDPMIREVFGRESWPDSFWAAWLG